MRLVAVRPGDPFNPERHAARLLVPTDDPTKPNTIASVDRPLFEWIDENGLTQMCPAKVTVYGGTNDDS